MESDSDEIEALFTNVRVPSRMNGVDLANQVNKKWPWIKLLIASGGGNTREEAIPWGSRFLTKPYRLERALANVEKCSKPPAIFLRACEQA